MEESVDLKLYSPLALAYLGDSVFDLLIKEHFVIEKNMQAEKYHKKVTKIVCAVNQAHFIDTYKEDLSEEELDVFRRGRNASSHSKAKHASLSEYKKATGFEAIIGYLYLKGDNGRLKEIIKQVLSLAEDEDESE